MHEEEALDPAHLVLLGLAGVVRDVVEEAQARLSEVAGEDLPDESADHLPVGQRAVDAGPHRGEILLSFRRPDRSAGQLAIRKRDAVTGGQRHELLQELGADLVAEAARAAVDRHEEIAFFETEGPGRLAVEDRLDGLQLQIVVARTEASDLVELPLLRPPADSGGVGSRHAPPLFDPFEVVRLSPTLLHRPPRAAREELVELGDGEPHGSSPADSRRHGAVEVVSDRLEMLAERARLQASRERAHATGDVEADAPRRHDASAVGIEGGDAADGKAVTPVGVRHGEGGADDARERGDVGDLLADLLVERVDQDPAREDAARHTHRSGGRQLPDVRFDFAQLRFHVAPPHPAGARKE